MGFADVKADFEKTADEFALLDEFPHSRYSGRAPKTHLRKPVAQSSYGRPARSPTRSAWHGVALAALTPTLSRMRERQ